MSQVDMSKEERESILEKIRKLMAKGSDKAATEAEAEVFMAKAMELLARYNLSVGDLEVKGEEGYVTHVMEDSEYQYIWVRPLVLTIGRLYFCRGFILTRGNKKLVALAGKKHNVDVAKEMLTYLVTTIGRLKKLAAIKDNVSPDRKRNYMWSFSVGASDRLASRLNEMYRNSYRSETKGAESGTTLPALKSMYDQAESAIQSYLNTQYRTGGRALKGNSQVPDSQGLQAGRKAGDSISLNPQVNGSSAAKTMIGN